MKKFSIIINNFLIFLSEFFSRNDVQTENILMKHHLNVNPLGNFQHITILSYFHNIKHLVSNKITSISIVNIRFIRISMLID